MGNDKSGNAIPENCHREEATGDRGDPVFNNAVGGTPTHNPLDCFTSFAMTNLEHDSRNTKKLEFVVLDGKIGLSDAQNIAVGKPAEESPDCVGQHTG